ncbi:hypothetical protein ACG3SL_16155 [Sphingomonas sp. CJ20]
MIPANAAGALVDAGVLATALFVARAAALWLGGGRGFGGWAARWLRRGVVVALLVPALRLGTLAAQGNALPPLLGSAALLLALGLLLAMLDRALAARRVTKLHQ